MEVILLDFDRSKMRVKILSIKSFKFGGEEDHEGREDQVEGPEAGDIGGDGGQNDVEQDEMGSNPCGGGGNKVQYH